MATFEIEWRKSALKDIKRLDQQVVPGYNGFWGGYITLFFFLLFPWYLNYLEALITKGFYPSPKSVITRVVPRIISALDSLAGEARLHICLQKDLKKIRLA